VQAIVLHVHAVDAEPVLDRVLPLVPAGVYDRSLGPLVELVVAGVVDRADLAGAAGDALVRVSERELPDDPAQLVAQFVDPPVVAGRFVIRPPSAPAPADPRLEDIVIDRGSAFGTGLHPTTQRCLELLLSLEPGGSFADLGCGTGVLAIGAARLGWKPVVAVDYDERSVEATARNAELNGVAVEARRVDLIEEAPPAAQTIVANVPARVHAAVRAGFAETPRQMIVSGVSPREADAVVAAYGELAEGGASSSRTGRWCSSPRRRFGYTAGRRPRGQPPGRSRPRPGHPSRCPRRCPTSPRRDSRTEGSRCRRRVSFPPVRGWPCCSPRDSSGSTCATSRTRSRSRSGTWPARQSTRCPTPDSPRRSSRPRTSRSSGR